MGTVLKAIIMSHENGGSYCIDSTGSFHFVKGYQGLDIGTEITIEKKKPARLRKICFAFAAILIAAAIAGLACARIAGTLGFGAGSGIDSVYARLCAYNNTETCTPGHGCTATCISH